MLLLALAAVPTLRPRSNHPPNARTLLGIDHVSFYTTAPDGVKKLYGDILGLASADPIEPGGTTRYMVGKQWVGYSPAPDPKATDRMDHVAFTTDNIVALRQYLTGRESRRRRLKAAPTTACFFVVNDPEGHRIEFVERGNSEPRRAGASAVSRHMIHTGFLVYHRDAEDHFYREILGFRPYWHGGMKDDVTDWVAPAGPRRHRLARIHAQSARARRPATDRRDEPHLARRRRHEEGAGDCWNPTAGSRTATRKRKWAKTANGSSTVFDPDLIRMELMEFKPVQKPCCSDFTGPHPTE